MKKKKTMIMPYVFLRNSFRWEIYSDISSEQSFNEYVAYEKTFTENVVILHNFNVVW